MRKAGTNMGKGREMREECGGVHIMGEAPWEQLSSPNLWLPNTASPADVVTGAQSFGIDGIMGNTFARAFAKPIHTSSWNTIQYVDTSSGNPTRDKNGLFARWEKKGKLFEETHDDRGVSFVSDFVMYVCGENSKERRPSEK